MHNLFTLTFACLLLTLNLSAQNLCQSGRYAEPVFDCVDTTQNMVYGQGRINWGSSNIFCQNGALPPYNNFQDLLCDIYEPCDDPETERPLLIVIHGGAWAGGDKRDMAAYCHQMALRGYVVASISYRLSITPNLLCWNAELDENKFIRAFYRAMQDAKAAVRYFRANAVNWRIDADNIYAAGHSAGAFTALGLAYLTDESERPEAALQLSYCGNWQNLPLCADLGDIEGEGGNPGVSSAIKAVIPMSGALPDLSYLDGASDPPMLLIHGTADDVVPYGEGCVLQNLRNIGLFNPCIFVYGSAAILPYADSIGMEAELVTFAGGGHGFTAAESDTIVERSARFLCCQLHDGNCQAVGTNELAGELRVELFPNPAATELNVRVGLNDPWKTGLYDVNGRLLIEQASSGIALRLDLTGIPAGIYALRIWQNNRTRTIKVVRS
ncbi:MAG: T9SS type A sorting domain-containing protein [Saprospiraceae bacterium]|nr:T9SS type A sorting domain-containing protein [Saprospiraceae bacterium]MDZ4702946.1 T9SS type A sorting domain-containing protein [Saprospiraceae bacterium]